MAGPETRAAGEKRSITFYSKGEQWLESSPVEYHGKRGKNPSGGRLRTLDWLQLGAMRLVVDQSPGVGIGE